LAGSALKARKGNTAIDRRRWLLYVMQVTDCFSAILACYVAI